jgi:hypothetical protein
MLSRRWLAFCLGFSVPFLLIFGGGLWALRAGSGTPAGSVFLPDPAHVLSRADMERLGLAAAPRGDGWRDLSPSPLAPGFLAWDGPRLQKGQATGPAAPAAPTAESGAAPSASGGVSIPRVVLTAPANNSSVPPGGRITFTWMPVTGAAFYFLEHSGKGLTFSNPNGAFLDARNGHLGQGGGFLIPGTRASLSTDIPRSDALIGAYRWRVIALGQDSNPIAVFSDAFTINIGTPETTAAAPEGGNR